MKQVIENGKKVTIYSLEDWQKGQLPLNIEVGDSTVKYRGRNGGLFGNRRFEFIHRRLPKDELEKIRKAQEKVYDWELKLKLVEYEGKFLGSWLRSENREKLVSDLIRRYQYILFPESRNNAPAAIGDDLRKSRNYPSLYSKVIVYGNRSFAYTLVNKPVPTNPNFKDCIDMEAMAKNLLWLEKVQNGEVNPQGVYDADMRALKGVYKEDNEKSSQKSTGKQEEPGAKNISEGIDSESNSLLKKLFSTEEWRKYILVLTQCTPPILKETSDRFVFIGNQKTEKGIVASWIKFLKSKAIVHRELNREQIADILNESIGNYSISPSSIDNRSTKYEKIFEPQLKDFLSNN